ncbi:hypothetical protein PVK06_017331 [Gossypium arboreum]|uniref:Uncharacterized protein n=1 Tax=Gossypium arboreum TaxID=29729 RepID=A0ABR0Q2F0_GOSAR|nr:hypothetical protein PVK06_017331 [Gossypium arboreum]
MKEKERKQNEIEKEIEKENEKEKEFDQKKRVAKEIEVKETSVSKEKDSSGKDVSEQARIVSTNPPISFSCDISSQVFENSCDQFQLQYLSSERRFRLYKKGKNKNDNCLLVSEGKIELSSFNFQDNQGKSTISLFCLKDEEIGVVDDDFVESGHIIHPATVAVKLSVQSMVRSVANVHGVQCNTVIRYTIISKFHDPQGIGTTLDPLGIRGYK